MNTLCTIMRRTTSYPIDCWWRDRFANAVINHAHRLGLVYRGSVTQVHWTQHGADLARKYGKVTQ